MLYVIFLILMFLIFGKLLMFALKASWALLKILLTCLFLPLTLIGMVLHGLMIVAFPVLIIIGIVILLLR